MATTTHNIPIDASAYVNVSNGNLQAALIVGEQTLRVAVAGLAPLVDTEDYVKVAGRSDGRSTVLSITDLDAESDVWVRNDANEATSLKVIRGTSKIVVSSA